MIDLHIDSFIWTRIFGYDLSRRHDRPWSKGFFGGQVDLPRLKDAGFTGALWSITTNPFRTSAGRARQFEKNLRAIQQIFENASAEKISAKVISHFSDYQSAKKNNEHAAFLTIQGGNALDHDLSLIAKHTKAITAVTLMHLLHSSLGTAVTPYPTLRKRGLTSHGKDFVRALDHHRIFLDLAHSDQQTFRDAVSVHDCSQPLLVSHTGVKAVHDSFRNIDDEQIRKVADTGGVIGIIFEKNFLGRPLIRRADAESWLERLALHLEHLRKIGGEDCPALGSDWDGMIIPPGPLKSCAQFGSVIPVLEKRGWTSTQIENTLGENFLRAFKIMRPGTLA